VESEVKRFSFQRRVTTNGSGLQITTSMLAVLFLLSSFIMIPAVAGASLRSELTAGQVLTEGQALTSSNGQYSAVLQGDGNFVVYNASGRALWADGINNNYGENFIVLQGDGNLVDYLWNSRPFWATGTHSGEYLLMQDDGNLVLYTATSTPLWSTGTGQVVPVSTSRAAYVYPGDAGICAAINSITRVGLNPATCSLSTSLQQCAVTWETSKTDCPWSGAAYTGIPGDYGSNPSGATAVRYFMATSSASLFTQSGIGPAPSYPFYMHVLIGIAWTPPNAATGGGFLAVVGVCANTSYSVVLSCT
jgi:hypothetical protein